MSRSQKTSNFAPINIASDDPEVMALQGMIRGLNHFDNKQLTMGHMKVLMAIELCYKVTKNRVNVTLPMVASMVRLEPGEFDCELRELIELRYVIEDVEITGPVFYKIGSLGGTLLKHMLDRPPKRTRKKQTDGKSGTEDSEEAPAK